LTSGSLAWKYRTVAVNGGHPHSGAAIMQSAALSADGATVFFGAENMYFYALNAATGSEVWRRKLGGQSFMYSWPVVFNGMVMTFVTVPHGGSEYVAEEVLDALPSKNSGESARDYATRIWPQERDALRTWLGQHPEYRNFYAMKVSDGTDAFSQEIPMGRVGGIGYPNRAPVVDNQNRILLYWRTRSASFLTGGTFGTKYTPDISALDQTTGDRVILPVSSGEGVEIDNTFMLSVGGNNLYWNNHMRGARKIDMTNGNPMRMSQVLAEWDGANYRNWGDKLIWIGNDSSPASMPPPSAHRSPQGDCSVVLASVGGKSMMFIQESGHYQINFGCIAAVEGN
jgi:outer membrane protein assembly factor BamB